MTPTVSVVLPVYNCPHLVGDAVECMLKQTWTDFELIIIDDGSTDDTGAVLSGLIDPRIRLIRQKNRGLAATLNRGIEMALGRYIARQDQDDMSYPERLAKQVAYLDAHPRCALVGTWATIWRDGNISGEHKHPSVNSHLQYELLLNNPFVHSSVMIRKAALDDVGGYSTDAARQPPEDYELWSRIARRYQVANIPEILHEYRELPGSMSRDDASPFMERLVTLSAENIAWAANLESTHAQVVNIAALVHGAPHRIAGKVDPRMMADIFQCAAQNVVAVHEREYFRQDAARRIDNLRYRYPRLFGTSLFARKLTGLARRTAALLRKSD